MKIKRLDVSYHHFHNILRLFDVLPNFPFTTSETMRDFENFVNISKTLLKQKSRNGEFHMKTRVSLKYFVIDCRYRDIYGMPGIKKNKVIFK